MTSELDRLIELCTTDNYHEIFIDQQENEFKELKTEIESLIEDGKKWKELQMDIQAEILTISSVDGLNKLESQITTLTNENKKYEGSIEYLKKSLHQERLLIQKLQYDNKILDKKQKAYDERCTELESIREQLTNKNKQLEEELSKFRLISGNGENILDVYDSTKKQLELAKTVINEIEKFKIKLNTWNNIDFEALKKTELKWTDEKTHGYKTCIMDIDTNLNQILQKWSGVKG